MSWFYHSNRVIIKNQRVLRLRLTTKYDVLSSPWLQKTNLIIRRPASGAPKLPRSSWSQAPRFDIIKARKAKPLITTNGLYKILTHRSIKWIGIIAFGSLSYFYYQRLETVPMFNRKRLMCVTEAEVEEDGKRQYDKIMRSSGSAILPPFDWRTRKVKRVMNRLLNAVNLQHLDWEVNVILSNEVKAFVIPGRKVFVHSGILPIAETDSGLATVLSHELAHSILRHSEERMSSQVLILLPLRVVFFWLFDFWTGGILGNVLIEYGLSRPNSRVLETEADIYGLALMATACYDPRGAITFWKRIELLEKAQKLNGTSWLSTHPSSESRTQSMIKCLPAAEKLRKANNCDATNPHLDNFRRAILTN